MKNVLALVDLSSESKNALNYAVELFENLQVDFTVLRADYKNDAMHYAVGQQVYGGHEISHILFEDSDSSYNIYIKKNDEVLPWKKFNSNMAISIEYDLEY